MNKPKTIIIATIGLVLLLTSLISSFGVSSKYYPGYPLNLQPGETKENYITLQNLNGKEDIQVIAEIKLGSEIMELTEPSKTYIIPAGEKTKVNMIITMPMEASPKDSYPIEIEFISTATGESGAVGFGTSIGQSFEVMVPLLPQKSPLEKGTTQWIIYVVVAIVIILLIIIFFIIKRKKNNSKELK